MVGHHVDRCASCQAELPAGASFCPGCGAPAGLLAVDEVAPAERLAASDAEVALRSGWRRVAGVVAVLAVIVGAAWLVGRTGGGGERAAEPAAPTTTAAAPTTMVEPTTAAVTDEPTTGPSGDGEWVQVAVDEAWVGSVSEIAALPGGGYVAVIGATDDPNAAARAGSPLSAVMWSPDGVEWFDGDPEREIELPNSGWFVAQLAVTSERVVVVDGADFTSYVPLAIGDPRTGAWDVAALEYAALDGRQAGVEDVGLAASTNEVLVAAYSAPDDATGMMDVVTWVVDPTTGTSETSSFRVARHDPSACCPGIAWVDGRWILIADEDVPGSEGEGRRNVLWTSSDGLAWSQVDPPDGMVGSSWLVAGDSGVAAVTCVGRGGGGYVEDAVWFSTDGLEWTRVRSGGHHGPLIAAGKYGFVQMGGDSGLTVVAADGSGVYRMAAPFGETKAAASSGDTLLVSSDPALWLYAGRFQPGDSSDAVTLTPVEWSISSSSDGASMIVEARPLAARDVAGIGASLIWEEMTITLCSTTQPPADAFGSIAIREAGDGWVHIGDIFGFDERPDMREAAASHGPPIAACISVATGRTVHAYCAPLAQASD